MTAQKKTTITVSTKGRLFPQTDPDLVFGMLPYKGEPKSLEEMERGIAAEAIRCAAREEP